MGLVLLFGSALAMGGVFMTYKMFFDFVPGSKRINQDLAQLKADVEGFVPDLVPWTKEEMELFSHNQIHNSLSKGITNKAKGVFVSIYHEPMLAYSYKKYIGPNNGLLYVRTAKREFMYRFHKKEVLLAVDGHALGTLSKDGILLDAANKKQMIARVNMDDKVKLSPIIVHHREIGEVVNPSLSDVPNPRALEMTVQDMSPEEETIFMALAIFRVVDRIVDYG